MTESDRQPAPSFWTSLPGFLTGMAAIITATFGAYAVFHHPFPTAELYINPPSINKGQSSTLSWQTTNASGVTIEEIGPVPTSGSLQVAPNESMTYHLAATGEGGTKKTTAQIAVTFREIEPGKAKNEHGGNTKAAQENANILVGDWRGVLQTPSIPLVFHINLGGASTSDSPNQGSYGMSTDVSVNGNNVQIGIPSVTANFQGEIRGTTIQGYFSQHGATLPMTLKSTVVGGSPNNLTGEWRGALIFPRIPLIFHINLNGTSTSDSPSQGASGMHTNVTSTGAYVQLAVPSVDASFEGTLHGTSIVGYFSQRGATLPLTLTKE